MKKLSILFLLLISVSVQAQLNNLEDNTYWFRYSVNVLDSESIEGEDCLFIKGDTIINKINYKKLFYKDYYTDYYCSIREKDNKIYAVIPNYPYNGLEEILLYDFNVKVGDTIKSNATEGALSRLPVVESIDTIVLENNEKRKRFWLSYGGPWIEGIGHVYDLLFDVFEHPTNGIITELVCCRKNEVVYYKNHKLCEEDCCSMFGVGVSPIQIPENKVKIYTNSGKVKITFPDNKESKVLIVTDIIGNKKLETEQFTDNIYNLDLSGFKNGIYILTVKYKKYTDSYKIVR